MPQAIDYAALAKQAGAVSSTPPPDPSGHVGPAPTFWQEHPNVAAVAKGALNTLPVIGATVGGMMATPETLGIGAPAGVVVGAGVGKGARDLAAHAMGLEESTPVEKATGIAREMEGTAAAGVLVQAAPLLKPALRFAINRAVSGAASVGDVVDPELIKIASPRIGAAVKTAQRLRDAIPAASASAPAEAASAAPAATVAPADLGKQVASLHQKLELAGPEFTQGLAWLKSGVSESDVLARIEAARAFNAKFGGALPTPKEVAQFVADRNTSGKWTY